jgi:hypothetical protein
MAECQHCGMPLQSRTSHESCGIKADPKHVEWYRKAAQRGSPESDVLDRALIRAFNDNGARQ